jgi:phosphoribosylanthranilate isomerase (EC 5.3.1.24)
MTKIKLCGLSRLCDIEAVNELRPEYVGFVFVNTSKRYISQEKAKELKKRLAPEIKTVGVFADKHPEQIAEICRKGIVDMVQLHGGEDEAYIRRLKALMAQPVIRAFCIRTAKDADKAEKCPADYILLDSGAGSGTTFDWKLVQNVERPYFLAGGLHIGNIKRQLSN